MFRFGNLFVSFLFFPELALGRMPLEKKSSFFDKQQHEIYFNFMEMTHIFLTIYFCKMNACCVFCIQICTKFRMTHKYYRSCTSQYASAIHQTFNHTHLRIYFQNCSQQVGRNSRRKILPGPRNLREYINFDAYFRKKCYNKILHRSAKCYVSGGFEPVTPG